MATWEYCHELLLWDDNAKEYYSSYLKTKTYGIRGTLDFYGERGRELVSVVSCSEGETSDKIREAVTAE